MSAYYCSHGYGYDSCLQCPAYLFTLNLLSLTSYYTDLDMAPCLHIILTADMDMDMTPCHVHIFVTLNLLSFTTDI